MERYIAIDNVCAWPNLTKMPDGAIVASIFNQPCHGAWEGDLECWASEDGGRTWYLRGTLAPHEPDTARMHVAAGLARNGDLVAIASGWTKRPARGRADSHADEAGAQILADWVCRSSDGGRTWSISHDFPGPPEPGMMGVTPFGDVLQAADGSLCFSGYGMRLDAPNGYNSAYFFRSDDDGRTWGAGIFIAKGNYNETALLHLGDGRWLAAARTHRPGELHQFTSEDDGRTWRFSQVLSLPGEHPGHLVRLPDGRILLTYGNRCPGHEGIDIRISDDNGRSWDWPRRLVALDASDLGYPATVASDGGRLVTAWYCSGCAAHQRYHMGALIWDVNEVAPRHKP